MRVLLTAVRNLAKFQPTRQASQAAARATTDVVDVVANQVLVKAPRVDSGFEAYSKLPHVRQLCGNNLSKMQEAYNLYCQVKRNSKLPANGANSALAI